MACLTTRGAHRRRASPTRRCCRCSGQARCSRRGGQLMAAAPMMDDAPPRVSTFESLRFRNFRLFFSGQLISQIGNWLTLIAQALLVLRLTDNGFALGLLAGCQFGPVLFLGPWSGLVADRSDKRKLLLIVQTFAMVQSFALAAIAFMDHPSVAAIY